jgi:hypothetical protein
MPEEVPNVPERLNEIGHQIGKYKDMIVKEFKNMEIEVKCWDVDVAKSEEEYTLEVDIKLAIRPKSENTSK